MDNDVRSRVDEEPVTAAELVGNRIRELRERHGTSLSALARAAKLSKATLSEVERGTANPTLSTLVALAAALDVHVVDLLNDERMPPPVGAGTRA